MVCKCMRTRICIDMHISIRCGAQYMINTLRCFPYSVPQDVFHNFFDNVVCTHVLSVLYYEELPEYRKRLERCFLDVETEIDDVECVIYTNSMLLLL